MTPAADASLLGAYRGVVCDLDGVVYHGSQPVPFAVAALSAAAAAAGVIYATNNASRPPHEVAAQLAGFGLLVTAEQVVTSSQAGAAQLAGRLAPGSAVLAIGGSGVSSALEEAGLMPVRPDAGAAAVAAVAGVLQGYGPLVTARDLGEASHAVTAGAIWVATNGDTTLPTERGLVPGNGTLVAAVARATGHRPLVVGKPEAPLYLAATARLGLTPHEVLAVGDRLDTDILGAMAAGLDSLWVLTGVDDLRALGVAPDRPRPTYVAPDLRALARPRPLVIRESGSWVCGDVRVRIDDGVSVTLGESARASRPGASEDADLDWRISLLTAGAHALCDVRDEEPEGSVDFLGIAVSLLSLHD
ncbi:MAG: HAD-IIA family hydrolase [Lapillicoccus sp.]